MERQTQFLLDFSCKPMPVGVVERDIERLHSFQDR